MIVMLPLKEIIIGVFALTGFLILANAGLIPLILFAFAGYVIYDNIRYRMKGKK